MLKKITNKIRKHNLYKTIIVSLSDNIKKENNINYITLNSSILSNYLTKDLKKIFNLSYSFSFSYNQLYISKKELNPTFIYNLFFTSLIRKLEDVEGIYVKEKNIYFEKDTDIYIIEEIIKKSMIEDLFLPILSGKHFFNKTHEIGSDKKIIFSFDIFNGFKLSGEKIPKNVLNNYYIYIQEINTQNIEFILSTNQLSFKYKKKSIFNMFSLWTEKIEKKLINLDN